MNQRLRVALAVVGITLYAIWCATKAYGHDAQVPHTHADMVVVSTTAFNNITGATNDINTNVNLQTVLDAIDNSTLPTASNIVINTNNFQYFAPTNAYLQTLLDWQDDNAHTNISNTNVYMTGFQNSNAFIGHSSTDYISAAGGQVNNKHLPASAVASSNIIDGTVVIGDIEPGYMKMPRIAGFTTTSVSNQCSGCAGASVSMLATTQYTRTTFLYGYCTLSHTSVPLVNVTGINVSVSAWVGPTNGGVFQQVADVPLSLTFSTGALAIANSAQNGSFCFPVPASNYVTFLATAVNTNAVQQDHWYIIWKLNATDATLP